MGKIYKIYRESNYIRVIDITTKELYNGAVKEVFVDKSNVQKNEYTLFNVKHFDETAVLAIGKILKGDGSAYSVSEWETFYTENTGNFNGSGTAPTVNTAFTNKAYSAIMNIAFDSANPNFEIDLTGNLDLTITGTSNGDSGLVNLYFSSTEVATLNGFADLVVIGAGEMIPIYFIHDSDGLKWYNDVTGGVVDTSLFALQDGTILYHLLPAVNTGTVSSSGTNWTTAGFSLVNKYLGAKITVSGQTTIINSINQDAATFTTVDVIPATNSPFEIKCISLKIFSDGRFGIYTKSGDALFLSDTDGYIILGSNLSIDTSGNITSYSQKIELNEKVYLRNTGSIQSSFKEDLIIYTFDTLPTFGPDVRVYASISDGGTPVYMTPASGGGSTNCSVYWNGTLWLYK